MNRHVRYLLYARLTSLGLLASLFISQRAWHGVKLLPRVLPLDLPFKIPILAEHILFYLIVFSTILVVLRPAVIIMRFTAISLLLLMLLDWQRWQPWPWYYIIIFLALSAYPRRFKEYNETESIRRTIIWISGGFYIWSGLHKLNPGFFNDVVPWLASPITTYLWPYKQWFFYIFYATPALEIAIGLMLVINPLRKYVWIPAGILHIGILLLLGPLGLNVNAVIWPWNVVLLIVLIVISFDREKTVVQVPFKFNALQIGLLGIVWFAPLLNYAGIYPKGWAFELYSGRNTVYDRAIHGIECKVPPETDPYVYVYNGKLWLRVYDICMTDTQLPPVADEYFLKRLDKEIARKWCAESEIPREP